MMNVPFLFAQSAQTAEPLILPDSVQKAQWADTVTKFQSIEWSEMLTSFTSEAIWVILKIIVALVIYYIGKFFIRWILRLLDKTFERRDVEISLRNFLKKMITIAFYLLLAMAVVQTLGINITSIIAIFSAATLAIGMALSGTMQNFAGGVMLLLLRPYRVGDYIEAQGQGGTVEEIMLFSTKILTADRQTIYVPNSSISTSIIDNYSHSELRRVDITLSIVYGNDVDVARKALLEIAAADKRILLDPETVVVVSNLAANGVELSLRAWVKNGDYWGVRFDLNEKIYKELPKSGVQFAYPHLDVCLKKEN